MGRQCKPHKTVRDHSVMLDGVRIWTCTNCGKRDRWSEGWSYYGSIECTGSGYGYTSGCGWPIIDRVACSSACEGER